METFLPKERREWKIKKSLGRRGEGYSSRLFNISCRYVFQGFLNLFSPILSLWGLNYCTFEQMKLSCQQVCGFNSSYSIIMMVISHRQKETRKLELSYRDLDYILHLKERIWIKLSAHLAGEENERLLMIGSCLRCLKLIHVCSFSVGESEHLAGWQRKALREENEDPMTLRCIWLKINTWTSTPLSEANPTNN